MHIKWQIFFYPLFVLSYKPKTRIWFSASWWSGNKKYFCFCLERVALYFKAIPNSIDFYKGIFLHVITVPIIVLCFKYSTLSTILYPVRLLALLLKHQGCSSSNSSSSRIVCILKISHDDGLANTAKLEHALHYFSMRKKDIWNCLFIMNLPPCDLNKTWES